MPNERHCLLRVTCDPCDAVRWDESCVVFEAGSEFSLDASPSEFVRLGFSACNEAELEEAVERLVHALL